MQDTAKHIAKEIYQQASEMIFGMVGAAFLFAGIGLLLAIPLWLTGNINGVESLPFMVVVLILAFLVLVFLIIKLWNGAAGFCIGVFVSVFLCGAGILLGPIK